MSSLFYATATAADGNMSLAWGEENQVVKNRKTFLLNHGIRLEDCVTLWLKNGDDAVVVDEKDKGNEFKADALITRTLNLPLFMVTADCFPVVIYDPVNKALALVHLGRAGTEKRFVVKVINELQSDPRNLQIKIGPGIRKESYLWDDVTQKTDPSWSKYINKIDGKYSVDLAGYIREQLLSTGVQESNIDDCSVDTAKDQNYFSHYRSARTGEPEGRFATVAMMNS